MNLWNIVHSEILNMVIPIIKIQFMFFMIFVIGLSIGVNLMAMRNLKIARKELADFKKGREYDRFMS
jgi:hypothetical protein